MLKHICIISHQHLSRNPRVLKESIALEKLGFKITLLTSIYNDKLLTEDYKLSKQASINLVFYNDLISKNCISFTNRLFNKIGRKLNKLGVENKYALGYAPNKCLKLAIAQNACLYICHQELPTYIGTKLLKLGKKVAFDFEDFYSEDLLPSDRRYRPQKKLAAVEKFALNFGSLCYTTSSALAKDLQAKYSAKNRPNIVFNSFPGYFTSQQNNQSPIQLIWLSQTIGPGRGLEEFIKASNSTTKNSFVLNLRGNISDEYQLKLKQLLTNKKNILNFLPLIPSETIQDDLTNYQIGLATEPTLPLNKDLTISNKIFHYLSVGLPVIATKTKGQLSLQKDFGNAINYYSSSEELTTILEELDLVALIKSKKNIEHSYSAKYDWSIQEKHLQQMISEII